MRGKSKQRGYGVRGDNSVRTRTNTALCERRYFGRDCRTTLAARNGEDFSGIPAEWCETLVRMARIAACGFEDAYDKDELADFAVYSVLKVLADIAANGEELDADRAASVCYAYSCGAIRSMLSNRREMASRTCSYDLIEGDDNRPFYDLIIDASAMHTLSPRARQLLNEAIMYSTTHDADRTLTYTSKGNIRVRSSYKCDELSLFTVARLHLGWAASTASRVVNEIRDDFFPNFCVRM